MTLRTNIKGFYKMANLIELIYDNTMNEGNDFMSFWNVMRELEETTISVDYGDETQVPLLDYNDDKQAIGLYDFFDREAQYGNVEYLYQEDIAELDEQLFDWEHVASDNTFNYSSFIERDFNFNIFKSDIGDILVTFNISTGLDPRGRYSTGFAMLFDSYDTYIMFMSEQFTLFNIELVYTDEEGNERRELFEVNGNVFSNEIELYCEDEDIQEYIETYELDEDSLLELIKELPLYEDIEDLEIL